MGSWARQNEFMTDKNNEKARPLKFASPEGEGGCQLAIAP